MLARGGGSNMTQAELAEQLHCDQSTISDDLRVLKDQAQRWLFDLAKGDLGYYFKQSIDGIEEAKAQAWEIYSSNSEDLTIKDKLAALKLIVDSNVERFKLISEGPNILAMRVLEERLSNVEAIAATNTRQAV